MIDLVMIIAFVAAENFLKFLTKNWKGKFKILFL